MLSRYSHVRMEAKLRALDGIAARQHAADETRQKDAERQQAVSVAESMVVQFNERQGRTNLAADAPSQPRVSDFQSAKLTFRDKADQFHRAGGRIDNSETMDRYRCPQSARSPRNIAS